VPETSDAVEIRLVTLADDVIELYRCRHCPRRLVKPQDRQALEELGDVSLCHCAGTPRQKRWRAAP
jgi:hypothetical protein